MDMEQAFSSEQEYSDYMIERDKIVGAEAVAKAAPEIKKQTLIELYTKGLLSAEAAAKELDMTVPAFLELAKAKASV